MSSLLHLLVVSARGRCLATWHVPHLAKQRVVSRITLQTLLWTSVPEGVFWPCGLPSLAICAASKLSDEAEQLTSQLDREAADADDDMITLA